MRRGREGDGGIQMPMRVLRQWRRFALYLFVVSFVGSLLNPDFDLGIIRGKTEEQGAKKKSNEPDRVSRT